MYLVKNGVPWDVAFGDDDVFRVASCVVMGELDGGEFDWAAMAFKQPEGS